MRGNIENPVGTAQVPLGVAGPLLILGEHARGTFYVPLATTEGALVRSYERCMVVLARAGGVQVRIHADENRVRDRGSWLLVVAREGGAELATIALGRGYCLHLINSFEDHGRLVVDLLEFERPIYDQYQPLPHLFTDVSEGKPVRLIVDVTRATVLERYELDYRKAPDFPSIDPRQAGQTSRDFWMLGISATGNRGRKFFDQLVHAAWTDRNARDVYRAPPFHYLGGEPAFVGDPEKSFAGIVVCQLFDAEQLKSAFVIFDAFNVARGPVATIWLKSPVHLGFHSSFREYRP